jgi:hypothetical protein
MKVKN